MSPERGKQSMNDDDKRCIREVFREEIKPLQDDFKEYGEVVRTLKQTMYGSDGEGGVKYVLNVVKNEVDDLKNFRTQVKTVAVTVFPLMQMGITVAGIWIKSLFTGNH